VTSSVNIEGTVGITFEKLPYMVYPFMYRFARSDNMFGLQVEKTEVVADRLLILFETFFTWENTRSFMNSYKRGASRKEVR
jgi:hypothetical protein